jgi:hypothetical protein
MKRKQFDCVEMKRAGGKRVYEAVEGISIEEEAEFWPKQTAQARKEAEARKARRTSHIVTW